jgi:hypothetical protein
MAGEAPTPTTESPYRDKDADGRPVPWTAEELEQVRKDVADWQQIMGIS